MTVHEIALDVKKRNGTVPPSVVVRVGDSETQTISAKITSDGRPYTSELPNVRLDILHEDGTWARCPASKSNTNKVTCTLPGKAISAPGRCRIACFVFYGGGAAESTEGFELHILPNVDVSDAEQEAQNYDDVLTELWERFSAFDAQARESEAARAEAERARELAQAKNNADQAKNNAEAVGLGIVKLEPGQYDPDTLQPTVAGKEGTLYFVPAPSALMEAVAGALGQKAGPGDSYLEWMWLGSAWERVGMSDATIVGLTSDQIDRVAAGQTVISESALTGSGLTYLWAKLRAAFAALSHGHAAADIASGTLAVARGGTGAGTAAQALTNLGAASRADLDAVRDSLRPRQISVKANSSLANYSSYASHSFVAGDVLFIHFVIALSKATDWKSDNLLLLTLPEGCRPVEETKLLRMVQLVDGSGATFWCSATVLPNGEVRVDTESTDGVRRAVLSASIRADEWALQRPQAVIGR